MRYSDNVEVKGIVKNGFDYGLQLWVENYIIQLCGHEARIDCKCNGKKFAGQDIRKVRGLK